MTKTEKMIRDILDDSDKGIQDLMYAIEQTAYLLFEKKVSMDQIKVTAEVYEVVATQLDKTTKAAAKEIQRLVQDCWTIGNQAALERYIGRKLAHIPRPRLALCYFAFYIHKGIPFFQYIEQDPGILFSAELA